MSTDKNQLLRELLGEREAILTALNYSYIVASGAWQARFQTYTGPGGVLLRIDSSELEYTLSNPSQLVTHYTPDVIEKANVNLIRITMRNAITQSYEKVQSFCEGDGAHQPKWEQAPWRPLARLVRNSFSHDFTFDFSKPGKRALRNDVKFTFGSGRTIELSNALHGKTVTGDVLPLNTVMDLLDEMRGFVERAL